MSSIDDRIVDLQFNNASFEKNLGTTIKSLGSLNKALELKDASKGLTGVGAAVRNLDFSNIANGVENISSKFNVMGAVGFSIINKLTSALMGFAGSSVSAIMDPLIEGGKRRAQNIEQAKFMIQGLKKSWTALYKDMDYAVAGTAYGIDQAARAASQLAASSIGAGKDMKAALRGISGVAAMTNSSYDDIAQVFTTVAGNGRVMASELNRISARGLNAAQALAAFFNEGRKGAKLTEADIREMASKGKISAMDFFKAMDGAFGAQATKANETYAGSLSNVKAALSRIGEKFATPVFEKQRNIFNQLRLVINGINKALIPFYDLWGKAQKVAGNAWVGILKSAEKAVGVLESSPNSAYAKDLAAYKKYLTKKESLEKKGKKAPKMSAAAKRGEKADKARDALLKKEDKAQKKYDAAVKKAKKAGKETPIKPQILQDKEKRESTDNQAQTPFVQTISVTTSALDSLMDTALSVFKVIGDAWSEVFPADTSGTSVILEFAKAFKTFADWLKPSAKQLESFKKGLSGFFTVVKFVFTIVSNVFQTIPGIFQVVIGVFKLLGAVFKPVTDLALQLANSFIGMFTKVGSGINVIDTVNTALTWLRENGIGKLLEILGNATKFVTDFWDGLSSGSDNKNLFAGFDPFGTMLETLKSFGATMAEFFQKSWMWAKGIYESLKDGMGAFGSGAGGFFKGLGDILRTVGNAIPPILDDLKSGFAGFLKGFNWSTLLAGLTSGGLIALLINAVKSFKNFFNMTEQAKEFVKLFKSGVIDALNGFTDTMSAMQKELKTRMIMNIAVAVGILAGAFWILSKVDIKGADVAAGAMTLILLEVMGALAIMNQIETDKGIIKMSVLTSALVLLGISLIAFAAAIMILSKVDPARLGASIFALGGGLMIMIMALQALSSDTMDPKKMILASIAMGILANALIVMAGAVALLGLLPLDKLAQGTIALVVLIGMLTLFAMVPSDNVLKAGVAVGIMAGSLMVMVGAIAILGTMNLGTLAQGMGALAIMILGLVLAVNSLKGAEGGAAAMVAMAFALVLLLIPIKTFSEMDSGKLAQGIGATIIALIGLVGAANMMQGAVAGAAAMVAMSVALGILTLSIMALAQIPAPQLYTALMAIGGGLIILLGAAAAAQLVAPGLFILAGAILAIGVAVLAAGAGMMLFAMGLALVGGAAQLAVPGLLALGNAAVQMFPQLLAMTALAFAIGALAITIAGLGIALMLLGSGLVLMGAGLALVGAVGGLGAIAVLAVWSALSPLLFQTPQITILGAALIVLGSGLAFLGGGLAAVGIGLALVVIALLGFMGTAFGVAASIDSLREAFERFVPITEKITPLASSINEFASSTINLGTALFGIASALGNAESGFSTFATSISTLESDLSNVPGTISRTAANTSTQLAILIAAFTTASGRLGSSVSGLGTAVQNGSSSVGTAMDTMVTHVGSFAGKLDAQTPKITSAITTMVGTFTTTFKTSLSGMSSTVGNSAESVGKYVLSGFLRGVKDPNNSIGAAARAMAQKFIAALRDEFKIKSPSKVMEEIGQYVKEGFQKGLTGFEDEPLTRVEQAVKDMKDKLITGMADAQKELDAAKATITKINKKKKKSKQDKKDLSAAKKTRDSTTKDINDMQKAMDLLNGPLKVQQEQLDAISAQYDIVVDKVKSAQSAYDTALSNLANAQKNYTEQFSKLPDFTEEGDLVNNYIGDLQKQIDATTKFAKDLAYLRSLSLDDATYQKILDKGLDAQPFIDALIESGQAGIDEIKKLNKQLDTAAGALGTTAGSELYQAGVDSAKGFLDGLKAQEAELKAQMTSLANVIVVAIKNALGIRSPSRVFAGIGGYSMIGLMQGMQKYIPALENTSENIGNTAADGLRNAINEIGDQVYGEMDMSPVIRPVLDLTDVTNSAKQLGNVFSSRSIDVGSVYADASNIAMASRERELLAEQMRADSIAGGDSFVYNQYNNSPKALSSIEIYRQTNNQLSGIKKGLPK